MMRRIAVVGGVFTLAFVAGCGDKEPESVPVQQAAAPAPATTKAAPTSAPARPDPAAAAAAAAAAEMARAPRLRTLQVGAFPDPATARWWVAELRKGGIPAYAVTAMVDSVEVTRLRIGAAVTGAEARALAEKIQARYHWPVWITMVEDRSVLPPDALSASRSYAGTR